MTHWCLFSPLPTSRCPLPPPTTRWCVFLSPTNPCQFPQLPTSLYDLLVCFFLPTDPPLPSTTTNESLWLVGWFTLSSPNLASFNNLQRVFVTHWLVFFVLPHPHQLPQPPTSLYDLLVGFLCCPLTSPEQTMTHNEHHQTLGIDIHHTMWARRIGLKTPPGTSLALFFAYYVSNLLFFLLGTTHNNWWPPRSLRDSLVGFLHSPPTSLASATTNKSLWLIGVFFTFSPNITGYYDHQRDRQQTRVNNDWGMMRAGLEEWGTQSP